MDNNNNISTRANESGTPPLRSPRFFEQEQYWYFRTREGLDIGPFDNLADAEDGLHGFLGFLQQAKSDVVTRITEYITLQSRKDESGPIPERNDRLFEREQYWYFRTREGIDIGPFDDRGSAAVGAKNFIGFLEESKPEVVTQVTDYIRAA